MSEVDQNEVTSTDSVTEPVPFPTLLLAMQQRHLPYVERARANNAQVLEGTIGMHAKLNKEDREKLVDQYLPKDQFRDTLPQSQSSVLPDKFSQQQAETELMNAFVAAYNVVKEVPAFGPKSAMAQKAKHLGGVGGRVFVPIETEQQSNEPTNATLDAIIVAGSQEGSSSREKGAKESAEAIKSFRLTVMQVALSLLLNPLPAREWTDANRKIYVFPKSVIKSTISPLIQSFQSTKTEVGTEDNLTLKKLRDALEVVCEVKSRVPQALGRLSTMVRGANDNLRTWAQHVANAGKTLQAELETDLVKKEHPNAVTTMPRVLWYIMMCYQTSRTERAFLKKLVEDKNSEGKRSNKEFSFEPWRDDETWEKFIRAFKGSDFESLKGPSKSDRKEIADTIPVMPDEAAKRRKTDTGRQSGNTAQPGARPRPKSAAQSATQNSSASQGQGRTDPGQSTPQSVGSKKQVQLSPQQLLDCKTIIESATQPTLRADGSVAKEVPPPCAICQKYFFSIKIPSSGKFLYDGHATYKCRMVKLNGNGDAYQTKKRKRIPKKP